MSELIFYIATNTLNINDLNIAIKRQRLTKWIFFKIVTQLYANYKNSQHN